MFNVKEKGLCSVLYCFFFQAEDGIRVVAVTGVQTCALPISPAESEAAERPPPSLFALPGRSGHRGERHQRGRSRRAVRATVERRQKTHRRRRRSEEHTSELQSRLHLVCRLLLENNNIRSPAS